MVQLTFKDIEYYPKTNKKHYLGQFKATIQMVVSGIVYVVDVNYIYLIVHILLMSYYVDVFINYFSG